MCLVHARVGSGLRSCACANSTVRLQCARPFTTDTLRSCCTAARRAYIIIKALALCHSNTHHWSARHVYPRRTILSPGFKTVSKVTLGRPPACRLRWPRCRGAGGGLAVPLEEVRRATGGALDLVRNRFGVMSRKLIAQIQDTVGPCGNDKVMTPTLTLSAGLATRRTGAQATTCSAPLTCAH